MDELAWFLHWERNAVKIPEVKYVIGTDETLECGAFSEVIPKEANVTVNGAKNLLS